MKILHISDLHLRGDGKLSFQAADTLTQLQHTVEYLKNLEQKPDMIMVTGDLADNGSEKAYQIIKDGFEAIDLPIYIVPGNHDKRTLFHQMLGEHCPVKEDIYPFICYTIDDMPIRIIALDTMEQGLHWGVLNEKVANWLEAKLDEYPDKPTLVFTHHPPFLTAMGVMDEPFINVEKLNEILRKHKNVKLCCGHMHRGITTKWKGVDVMTAPPISMMIELDLTPKGGNRFFLSDPGYAIHHLFENQINTHFCIIPTDASYSGPHEFVGSENPH